MLESWNGPNGPAPVWPPVYTRTMPGGGSVRVELLASDVRGMRRRGRVVIDARDASTRAGGTSPLVVEEVEGDDEDVVVTELLRIARDNAALARRVLRRRSSSAPRAD